LDELFNLQTIPSNLFAQYNIYHTSIYDPMKFDPSSGSYDTMKFDPSSGSVYMRAGWSPVQQNTK